MPNKVKIFSWLYFKDRLSTKSNLFHKHVKDDSVCQRCNHPVEDRHHVFFDCPLSKEVWSSTGLSLLSTAEDVEVWSLPPPSDQDPKTWPSILQAILWRLWDARNAAIFRSKRLSARNVLSKVCDDLAIWESRFASASMVPGLRQWRTYLRYCISNQGSV
jgi:hypothetical protein